MKQARLYPNLPPEGKPAFCFYPMSKRRDGRAQLVRLGFEERKELMIAHGAVGRTFHGRILQLITGSTGLDDWEWGVTLFGVHPDDLKACVYEMRFDEASARYAEFGPFITGMVDEIEDVLDSVPPYAAGLTATGRPGGRRRRRHVGGRRGLDLDRLRAELRHMDRVVVAFSGGADSAFLARVATDTLGASRVLCVTAVSPSLAPEERDDCRSLASEWGLRWQEVVTQEMDDPAYRANDGDRCYHCKTSLLAALAPWAETEAATVVLGVNVDDLGDHRPGQRAAAERGAVFPLVAAGYAKADVRRASRQLGLRTWDKPAAACLASRVPYGTPVTLGTLTTVAAAESGLRALGFRQLRVRHYGDLARIELDADEMALALRRRSEVVDAVRRAGYPTSPSTSKASGRAT